LIWEAVMYSAHRRLDNLCVLVDNNNGQLDIVDRLIYPLPDLEAVFGAFGWHVESVDATQYDGVFTALQRFKYGDRNGKPTAIVCRTTKGHGGFSSSLNAHKATIAGEAMERELMLQAERRRQRVDAFAEFFDQLAGQPQGEQTQEELLSRARRMHLRVDVDSSERFSVTQVVGPMVARRAPRRDKSIRYNAGALPRIDKTREYGASAIVTAAMKVFALDGRVVSIDADLGSTSGLEAGISAVDQNRALNVGVAEANMMNIGEAYAALGYNTWVSTFCPFFDWKVLRRIAVGYQERLEAMEAAGGWLSEGHGLDLTHLATAPNFETRTNGATHMGNDDITIFDGLAHLKIVDVSCPRQLLAIMQWIMEGNRGLVYLRVMRTPSAVLYDQDFSFQFGRGYFLRRSLEDAAVLVTSGRGVHEAMAAAAECARRGLPVAVVDMPSIDEQLLLDLYQSRQVICFAEQNNGYIWQSFLRTLGRHKGVGWGDLGRVVAVNTLGADGKPRFIHSGTYEELLAAFRLTPACLAETVVDAVRAVDSARPPG
jgi:transketolase C-terminal domain/subunit